MGGIEFLSKGSTSSMEQFLNAMQRLDIRGIVTPFAEEGVNALRAATPIDTGLASESWYYEIDTSGNTVTISWHNKDIENGFPVAIMLQYGYGTGTGGYVHGRDYINPALRPIFDNIADAVWKVVTTS